MLVAGSIFAVIIMAVQSRIGLGDGRASAGNMPTIEGPEMDPAAKFAPEES